MKAEIIRIEGRAQDCAVSIRSILQRAGLAASNWARWKSGKTSPTFKTWAEVTAAANSLFNERENSACDNKAGRDPASSPHPIPETGLSPRPDELPSRPVDSGSLDISSSLHSSFHGERRESAKKKS
ncbi:hypothetical protein [Bradyrhizobium sp. LA7.1]|uniref:hypothetical protein n=1 Tax=Bradyrhizobium sp. LA7.1 TaxID=3156324 RepID=UPI00339302A8